MAVSIWVGYPRSYTPGRNRPPQYVVMHGTAGNEGPTSAENGAQYDKTRTDETSTHYFTDSAGPALQEVPEGDRAHTALFHGNEIGIQIEVCGLPQTREQWLDPASYATLVTTAALARDICIRNGFEMRLLSVAETRAAYYNAPGSRPTGITEHARVTQAYPEDNGDHMDLWDGFPWDVFMDLVVGETPPQEDEMKQILVREGPTGPIWHCDGMWRRLVEQSWLDPGVMGPITNHRAHLAALLGNLQTGTPGNGQAGQWEGTGQIFVAGETGADMDIWGVDIATVQGGGGPGGGLSFAETADAAEQGARAALSGATITPAG